MMRRPRELYLQKQQAEVTGKMLPALTSNAVKYDMGLNMQTVTAKRRKKAAPPPRKKE